MFMIQNNVYITVPFTTIMVKAVWLLQLKLHAISFAGWKSALFAYNSKNCV